MSLKYQTRDPQLKVPPGGLVLRIFTSTKIHRPQSDLNPRTLISRQARYPETTEAEKITNYLMSKSGKPF